MNAGRHIPVIFVKIGALIIIYGLSAGTCVPAAVYVDIANPTPTPPYQTWATAATNLQDAIDAANSGDQILVNDGIYRARNAATTNVISVTNTLILSSINGPQATIIDGEYQFRCAQLKGNTRITGFTFTNGFASVNAGGVQCDSTSIIISNCALGGNFCSNRGSGVYFGTVKDCQLISNTNYGNGGGAYGSALINCALRNNSAAEGGGLYSGTASNCVIAGNNAIWGGGAYQSTLSYCTIRSNTAWSEGGGAYSGTAANSIVEGNSARDWGGGLFQTMAQACIITGNSAAQGGGVYAAGISNCTIVANSAISGGGIEDGSCLNCILYYNIAPIGANYDGASVQLQNCCTKPLPPGTGNFTNEPQMAGESQLSANSPCRGAGSTNFAKGRDIDGELWLNPPSIGCDELNLNSATGAISIAISAPYTNVAIGKSVNLTLRGSGRLTASRWEFGDGTIVSNRPFASHSWSAIGDYVVVARAFNNSFPNGVTAAITVHVVPAPVHYVTLQSANPAPPYNTWTTAATNIQDAVDVATVAGAVVLVSNGVYEIGARAVNYQTNRLVVDKPITVRSVNGVVSTILRGSGHPYTEGYQTRGIYLKNGASVEGLSVIDGVARGTQNGGGIWCESQDCFVTACVLSNNYSEGSGGGVFSGTLSNCTFLVNSAQSGGGAAWSSLANCYASSNRAVTGAAAFQSDVSRCFLIGNSANNYGGGASQSTLNRSIVAGNSAYYGGGGVYASTVLACWITNNYCDTFGGGANGSALFSSLILSNTAGSRGGGVDGSTLTNCTLVGNVAFPWGGGGAAYSTLRNCIAYNNFGTNGPNFLNSTLEYCCTRPAPGSGGGNFTNEPVFVSLQNGNLHLQSNSPCINSGNNTFLANSADFDGRPRLVDNTVDVGAFEYQAPGINDFIAWLHSYALPVDGSADYADFDNDSFTNWQEWRAGTIPTNSSSALKMISVSRLSSGLAVSWESVNGVVYFLQLKTNLASVPGFSTIGSNIAGQTVSTTYIDTNAPGFGPFFYRVGVQD